MSDDFKVTGAEDFLKLSKALKEAGRGALRKELNKGLREAVKPLTPRTREQAIARLPRSGGLAAQVAKEPQRVQVRTGSSTAGVRLVVAKAKGGARGANVGTVRHPVFGNRNAFVNQPVTPGWFDDVVKADGPEMEQAVRDAMQAIVDKIVKGG